MENSLEKLPEWMKGYIAGLVDGEGYIGLIINKIAGWSPRLRIGMSSRLVIHTLYSLTAVGTLTKNEGKMEHWKTMYRWTVCAVVDLRFLLVALIPYLLLKRRQAELLLEYCDLKITKRLTEDDCVRIHDEIRRLNKEG